MPYKSGFKSSEFYVYLATIAGVFGVGLDAISKTDFVSAHPAIAAGVAIASSVVAGLASIGYGIGRSIVKANATPDVVLDPTHGAGTIA